MGENELSAWEQHDQYDVRRNVAGEQIAMVRPKDALCAWHVIGPNGRIVARGASESFGGAKRRADTAARAAGWVLR